eukprot:5745212-Pyramimonas_sp.AAC.1
MLALSDLTPVQSSLRAAEPSSLAAFVTDYMLNKGLASVLMLAISVLTLALSDLTPVQSATSC